MTACFRLNTGRRPPPFRAVPLLSELPDEYPALLIPDVHQDLGFLERAAARARQEGAAIALLGDYVDGIDPRWREPAALRAIARAVTDLTLEHPLGCVCLVGNHDLQALQLARVRSAMLLEGDDSQVEKLDAAMPAAAGYGALLGEWSRDFLGCWRMATVAHGYLLTHAGVARRHWPWGAAPEREGQLSVFLDTVARAWDRWLRHDETGPLFEAGPGRGGRHAPVGGPLWLDWDTEFVDDLPYPQVVGHTRAREPRRKDRSWCIDAAQSCVALLDPNLGLRTIRL